MTCKLACTELGLPLAGIMSDGFDCYKTSGGKCKQNDGANNMGSKLVCKKPGKCISS